MTQDVVRHVLATSVATAGTFLVGYPDNRDAGNYLLGRYHYVRSNTYGTKHNGVTNHVSFSFGATGVTITNSTGETWAAGTELYVNLDQFGMEPIEAPSSVIQRGHLAATMILDLGAPDTADVDGLITAFTGAASAIALNGALTTNGVGLFDVPRNIVVDSGGADTAVLTFTGRDEYGEVVVESITANGTAAVQGKKAFKYIDSVTSSLAAANGIFVGPGDILGLPVFLSKTGMVLKEMEDGAAPTAGTVVAGVRTAATATTGDVRGTYDPNSACDGAKVFSLVIVTDNPSGLGVPQYAG